MFITGADHGDEASLAQHLRIHPEALFANTTLSVEDCHWFFQRLSLSGAVLEELRAESARLRALNRDLASRVGDLSHRCLLFRRANHRLRVESAALSRRLDELRRLVLLRQVLMVAASPPVASHGGFGGVGCDQAWAASLIA